VALLFPFNLSLIFNLYQVTFFRFSLNLFPGSKLISQPFYYLVNVLLADFLGGFLDFYTCVILFLELYFRFDFKN
jgi:hypothetical protein